MSQTPVPPSNSVVPAIGVSSLLLRLSKYRQWLICVPFFVAFSSATLSLLAPEKYTAYARLLPPQTNTATASSMLNQVGGSAALGASALALKNPSDLYASLFFSRTIQDAIIEKFNLSDRYQTADMDDLRALVSKNTRAEVGRDGMITLSYTDTDPKVAANLTNSMIEVMYQIAQRLGRSEAERRIEFYTARINEAKDQLDAANQKLIEAGQRTGLSGLKGQEESSSVALLDLHMQIASREVELKKIAVTVTPRHPEAVRIATELAALRAQLKKVESSPTSTKSVAASKAAGDQFLLSSSAYPQISGEIEPLRRDVEIKGAIFEQMLKARAYSEIDDSRDLSIISVLDPAVPPTKKSGPRVMINTVAGLVIGFLVSVILALAWDVLFTDAQRRERWGRVIHMFLRRTSKASN